MHYANTKLKLAFHAPLARNVAGSLRCSKGQVYPCFNELARSQLLVVCPGRRGGSHQPNFTHGLKDKVLRTRLTVVRSLAKTLFSVILMVALFVFANPADSMASMPPSSAIERMTTHDSSKESRNVICSVAVPINGEPSIKENYLPVLTEHLEELKKSASTVLHTRAGIASVAAGALLVAWRLLASVRRELKLRFLLSEFLSSEFFKIFDFWKVLAEHPQTLSVCLPSRISPPSPFSCCERAHDPDPEPATPPPPPAPPGSGPCNRGGSPLCARARARNDVPPRAFHCAKTAAECCAQH